MDIDLRDHCGHTPLHLAARAGHASAVAILVAHGADVTAKVRAEQSYSILVGCPPPPCPCPCQQPAADLVCCLIKIHRQPPVVRWVAAGSYMELSNRTATGCGRPIGQGHRRPKDDADDFAQFLTATKINELCVTLVQIFCSSPLRCSASPSLHISRSSLTGGQ